MVVFELKLEFPFNAGDCGFGDVRVAKCIARQERKMKISMAKVYVSMLNSEFYEYIYGILYLLLFCCVNGNCSRATRPPGVTNHHSIRIIKMPRYV